MPITRSLATKAMALLLALALVALASQALVAQEPNPVPTPATEAEDSKGDMEPGASQSGLEGEGSQGDMVAARKEILEAMLSPEAMLAEPPLTERDFEIFIEFFSLLLNSDQRFDFKAFAASNGITLRRFNYVSAKISWPLGEPSRRGPIVNELGLGVLMNGEEREIFLRREPELAKIAESLGQALRR